MNKLSIITLIIFSLGSITGCQNTQSTTPAPAEENKASDEKVRRAVNEYLMLYSLREDFELFLSFYHDNAVLEDLYTGERKEGKQAIKAFLNWPDEKFSLANSEVTLLTDQVVVQNKVAAIKGYFLPFEYGGLKLGPWHFTTWLEFNDDLKIIRHTDMINYTPRALFSSTKDANSWIHVPRHFLKQSADKQGLKQQAESKTKTKQETTQPEKTSSPIN